MWRCWAETRRQAKGGCGAARRQARPHPNSGKWTFRPSRQTWTFAREFQNAHSRLDVLVNNVGAAFPQRTETVDLIESTLAVNHIAPFLVTQLLLPLLRQSPAARIVNVNSELHRRARPPVDHDPQSRTGYNPMKAYAHAKFVNLLWSYELARQVGRRHYVNALHPGIARTALTESGAFPAVFTASYVFSIVGTPPARRRGRPFTWHRLRRWRGNRQDTLRVPSRLGRQDGRTIAC